MPVYTDYERLRYSRESRTRLIRLAGIGAAAIALAIVTGGAAAVLSWLVSSVTNFSFYGRLTSKELTPTGHHLGGWVILVPVAGGLIVGLMSRFLSREVRGHGLPEAIENVLFKESRVSPGMTILKPLSSAISIGTGGPFGQEGPIIATGGALGSALGQLLTITPEERKVLLSAGAAAGMSAAFGCPVAAVLLALELLMFSYQLETLAPVMLASMTGAAFHYILDGSRPEFAMPLLVSPGAWALVFYGALGLLCGAGAAAVSTLVFAMENLFERLPVHWMWWPSIGGLAVGVLGYADPHVLGMGYDSIEHLLRGQIVVSTVLTLLLLKTAAWAVAMGSGTAGGVMAPLFLIGGCLGAAVAALADMWFPGIGIDTRMGALVGMAAMFSGASRAVLTSVIFAFEVTRQANALVPLLESCALAAVFAMVFSKHNLMTEKLTRRGLTGLGAINLDPLALIPAREAATAPVQTLSGGWTLGQARAWISGVSRQDRHQGYPVVDAEGKFIGLLMTKDIQEARAWPATHLADLLTRKPLSIPGNWNLREAADLMALEEVGRLGVTDPEAPGRLIGILTRSDLMNAREAYLQRSMERRRLWTWKKGPAQGAPPPGAS